LGSRTYLPVPAHDALPHLVALLGVHVLGEHLLLEVDLDPGDGGGAGRDGGLGVRVRHVHEPLLHGAHVLAELLAELLEVGEERDLQRTFC
jgi:hypothetical protein